MNVWHGPQGAKVAWGIHTELEPVLFACPQEYKTSARFSPFQDIQEWACRFVKMYIRKLK
jgi:hypothetical protein